VVGTLISYLLGAPGIAVASAAAFAVGEVIEWLIFTVTKRPFRDRVMLSVCCSVPFDSAIFLLMAGFFTGGALIAMSLSKMFVAAGVWCYYHYYEVVKPGVING